MAPDIRCPVWRILDSHGEWLDLVRPQSPVTRTRVAIFLLGRVYCERVIAECPKVSRIRHYDCALTAQLSVLELARATKA